MAAAVGLISVPLFGHLSDKIGRRTMYGIGIACVALFAFPYFGLLNTTEPGLVLRHSTAGPAEPGGTP